MKLLLVGDGVNSSSGVDHYISVLPSAIVSGALVGEFLDSVLSSPTFLDVFKNYPNSFDLATFPFITGMPDWEIYLPESNTMLSRNQPLVFNQDGVILVSRARRASHITLSLDTSAIRTMKSLDLFQRLRALGPQVVQFFIPHMVTEELERAAKGLTTLQDLESREFIQSFLNEIGQMQNTSSSVIIGPDMHIDSEAGRMNDNIIIRSIVEMTTKASNTTHIIVTKDIAMAAKCGAYPEKIARVISSLCEVAEIPYIKKMLALSSSKVHIELSGFDSEQIDDARIRNNATLFGGEPPVSVLWEFCVIGDNQTPSPRVLIKYKSEKVCDRALVGFGSMSGICMSRTPKPSARVDEKIDAPPLQNCKNVVEKKADRVDETISVPLQNCKNIWPTFGSALDTKRILSLEETQGSISFDASTASKNVVEKEEFVSSGKNKIVARGLELVPENIESVRTTDSRVVPISSGTMIIVHGFPSDVRNEEIVQTLQICLEKSPGSGLLSQKIRIGGGLCTDQRAKLEPYFNLQESKVFVEFVDVVDASFVIMNMGKLRYRNDRFLNAISFKKDRTSLAFDVEKSVKFLGFPNSICGNETEVRAFVDLCCRKTNAATKILFGQTQNHGNLVVFAELMEKETRKLILDKILSYTPPNNSQLSIICREYTDVCKNVVEKEEFVSSGNPKIVTKGFKIALENILHDGKMSPTPEGTMIVVHGFPLGVQNERVIQVLLTCLEKSPGSGLMTQKICIGKGRCTDQRAKSTPYFGLLESKVFVEFIDRLDADWVIKNIATTRYQDGRFLNASLYRKRISDCFDVKKTVAFFGFPVSMDGKQTEVRAFVDSCCKKTNATSKIAFRRSKAHGGLTVFAEFVEEETRELIIDKILPYTLPDNSRFTITCRACTIPQRNDKQ